MISQDELSKIGKKLSKIDSHDTELFQNISDILAYMDMLNSVDTQGVVPTISPLSASNIPREDEETQNIDPKDLLACSKQKVIADHIALPNIMK